MDLGALNAWLEDIQPPLCAGDGRVLRLVPPDRALSSYEERIFETGEVVTRAHNWHDFFNALVWLTFPKTKAALNALHVRLMRQAENGAGRGPVRDAVTQFDESGVVVASADPTLLELLTHRCWKELFWRRRADVLADMRFLVFGHGLYDALRAPFHRICGRTALIQVERDVIDGDLAPLCGHVDGILATRFSDCGWYPKPKALLALPLLGIPGVTEESERPEYYDDVDQFRPLPTWAA